MAWIYTPDPPMTRFDMNNYGPGVQNMKEHDALKDAKAAVRFYNAILAEEERKQKKKKDDDKKKDPPKSTFPWQAVLIWTMPFQCWMAVQALKELSQMLDTLFK